MTERLRGWLSHLQVEDLSLVLILIATPFLAPITAILPVFGDGDDFIGGLVAFLAAVGASVALATRVPDENRLEKSATSPAAQADMLPVRMWLIGPFIGAVGFVAGDSLDRMGLPGGDSLIAIAFLVGVVAFVAGRRLPVVSRTVRRVLVGPFVLLCAATLQQFAADFTSSFAGTDVLGQLLALNNLGLVVTLLGTLGFAALIFYEMFVFAPRELADPGASAISWGIRFAIFYVSLVVAILGGGSSPLLLT
jgi:hypothetical protein